MDHRVQFANDAEGGHGGPLDALSQFITYQARDPALVGLTEEEGLRDQQSADTSHETEVGGHASSAGVGPAAS